MNKNQIKKIRNVNSQLIKYYGIPKRSIPLPDPLDLIIATILSQNTNDNNSFKAYKNLRSNFKNWDALAQANLASIEKQIKIAGLGKQKSQAIKNLLVTLIQKYGETTLVHLSKMNNEEIFNELISFNGIGVKTASCVLLFSLDRNICPVDTHVHRIVNRTGILSGKTPEKSFAKLNQNFPAGIAHQFHTNLIRLGREICRPNKPLCPHCPIKIKCKYPNKTKDQQLELRENDFMLLDNV